MKYVVLILMYGLMVFQCAHAHAARIDNGDNKTIYIDTSTGKVVSALEANREGMKDDSHLLACKHAEMVCSERTGRCSLKNAK